MILTIFNENFYRLLHKRSKVITPKLTIKQLKLTILIFQPVEQDFTKVKWIKKKLQPYMLLCRRIFSLESCHISYKRTIFLIRARKIAKALKMKSKKKLRGFLNFSHFIHTSFSSHMLHTHKILIPLVSVWHVTNLPLPKKERRSLNASKRQD